MNSPQKATALRSVLNKGWWFSELPGYRLHPRSSTYSLFSYEDLPPIPDDLDAGFQWLHAQPVRKRSLIEGMYADGIVPDLGKLERIIEETPVAVPDVFIYFIRSPELHRRIRSCTDCYLDVADWATKPQVLKMAF
ncbi:MAG: hypothetical protein JO316_24210 [Abitibacteriaceae bacterium]|nr:hypothetical protein [Abditibacteriaceae bacterium]